ncbi:MULTISPECIES: 23S rRNA (pseudouridine(1915)-N(3))-methyltransferase RlmH [Psychroflexus]|uniref:Ribosomal RNA large subunit methyltransferase H n=1 Tax=Psychroflexus halocasei TaxID=908615 RepID=A0A1H3YTP4_9FLAO|nr:MULTISPECIES: 23S rRNA (pseudouridine(1915)-N(3))-methyltransferase RlmH [Psychroflexus]PJX24684.1 23S rRNA (pseudouridine(1915)-N(3))-methyltransferase RlmH [Psychroflexus sp. S27]SEA14787.1 23S rRNA (pseudouridine1915-N3)-methyltransferase [Psychroflexus halocasei]
MHINLIVIGKTDQSSVRELVNEYHKRIQHFTKFNMIEIPDVKTKKNTSEKEQKAKEAELILKHINKASVTVLLDEKGKEFTSVQFSSFLQKKMNTGIKTLNFIIGGPYGFDQSIYDQNFQKIALSKMTFSHQMIRIFMTEQIYRGFTILNNLPYHHH